MNIHEPQAYWQQQVERHHASGLSAKAFAKQHELNYSQFLSWRKRLARTRQAQGRPGFAKVEQAAPLGQLNDQGFCINLPNGIRITTIGHENLGVLLSMLRQW